MKASRSTWGPDYPTLRGGAGSRADYSRSEMGPEILHFDAGGTAGAQATLSSEGLEDTAL